MDWHPVTPTVGWHKQQFESKLDNGVRLIVHGDRDTWHVHARNAGRHVVWMAEEAFFATADAAKAAAEWWVAATSDTAHRPRTAKLRRWMTRWSGDRRVSLPYDSPIKVKERQS